MYKKSIILITSIFLLLAFIVPYKNVFAQGSIIPEVKEACPDEKKDATTYLIKPESGINNLIACAIKTGNVHTWMIPYFLKYLAEFLIGLAGILCMFFIVLGGYQYLAGGLSEEKEKGKRTIIYAVTGLGLVLLSWTIVNVVLFIITD